MDKIINCIRVNDVSTFKLVFDIKYLNCRDSNSKTLLIYACISGNEEIVNFLLDNGADINKGTEGGITPLMYAVCKNHIEIVKILLNRGADVNRRMTVIERNSALLFACYNNYYEIGKLLLEHGANPNIINNDVYGTSPLLCVCQNNNYEFAELLLEYGANINITDNHNETILFHIKDLNMMRFLLKRGINVNHANRHSNTDLIYRCIKKNKEHIKLLLEYDADINYANSDNETALFFACEDSQHFDITIVELLLSNDAIVTHQNNRGKDVLHIAHKTKNKKLITLLLNHIY